jgi:hypothetical protein
MELLGLKIEEPLAWELGRSLSEAEARTPGQSPVSHVKKLRERHHALARMLAAGMMPQECGQALGYCPSRISILQNDPSFKELLEFYKGNLNSAVMDIQAKLGLLAGDTISELQDRLEDEPESFKNTELTELLKATTDRIGFGPSSTVKNLSVVATATLDELKKQVLGSQRGQIIDITQGQNEAHDPQTPVRGETLRVAGGNSPSEAESQGS